MSSTNDLQQTPTSSSSYDDALHTLVQATRRPTTEAEEEKLRALVRELMGLCGSDPQRWKTFVLSLTYKRFHPLSPYAKEEAELQEKEEEKEKTTSSGEGERRIFYIALEELFKAQDEGNEWARKALDVLALRLAPIAGGSRDVCTLLVNFVSSFLLGHEQFCAKRATHMDLYHNESLSLLIQDAIKYTSANAPEVLDQLVQLAADQLDRDLEFIQAQKESVDEKKDLPSTLHIFLPHHERGRSSSKKKKKGSEKKSSVSNRHLANCVAEILIWSKTATIQKVPGFAACFDSFTQENEDKKTTKARLHKMQCIIRHQRKQFNGFARQQGFMLADQFVLNSNAIKLSSIQRGKAGDVNKLTQLAKKKTNSKVLNMIASRFLDPSKVTRFASISDLIRDWAGPPSSDDEMKVWRLVTRIGTPATKKLSRDICVARVLSTVDYLASVCRTNNAKKQAVVCSMDNSQLNHIAAALVAAALSSVASNGQDQDHDPARLFVGGVQQEGLRSMDSILSLLDGLVQGTHKNAIDAPTFMDDQNTATTKAVLNAIDRHLKDNETLVLLTAADIQLPSNVMAALTARGCGIHAHDADLFGERLQREGARKGDITISLAWNTFDDLDLHVICPSGEEIYYSNKTSRDGRCNLDVDMNAGGGDSKEPVENVFLGDLDKMQQAPAGHYKVVVQNYAYHTKDRTAAIPFHVVVDMNGEKQNFTGSCVGTGKKSDVIVTEFDYKGRSVPFPGNSEDTKAFGTSNIVNLTASTGSTVESLGQLCRALEELEQLNQVRTLVEDSDSENEGGAEVAMEEDDDAPEEEPAAVDDSVVGDEVCNGDRQEQQEPQRPVIARTGHLEVTSRDLLQRILANLPPRFHQIVGETFGGPSLIEECAKELSRRMVADQIPISELKQMGYPKDIVELVKKLMATTTIA